MATTQDFIEFVCEQIKCDFDIRYKKMFGEYMVYANDKPILTVCDNVVYVKKAKELSEILEGAEVGFPYKGAKEKYILDIENTELTNDVVQILEEITPLPKPKRKKK